MSELMANILKTDTDDESKSFFRHYGILGMKWGVRRSRAQLARARGETVSDDTPRKSGKLKKGEGHIRRGGAISDAELRSMINRLQMEKQYADLTKPKPGAGKFIGNVLKSSGQVVIQKYTTKALDAAVAQALAKAGMKTTNVNTKDFIALMLEAGGGKKKSK